MDVRLAHATFALLLGVGGANAEPWTRLDGEALTALLSERILDYDAAWQRFHASGRTLYNARSESWGYWRAEGDRYCSQWPPRAEWACYSMEVSSDGASVRFLGDGGDVSIGRFRE